MSDAPIVHAPGVYFGLSAEEYHADKALGSSGIKALSIDPYDWRFDQQTGEDIESDALLFGEAVHTRVLEGPNEFNARFYREPAKIDVEGMLVTTEDLKNFLTLHGVAGLSKHAKPALIKLAQEVDPTRPIYDVLKAERDEANAGKTMLKAKRWKQVETASQWMQRDPLLGEVMENGTFSHGAPEVSVFYEDRGVRLKARFDRMLRHAIVDLKTFAPRFDGPIDGPDGTAVRTIRAMRYGIQAAAYLRAWDYAKELYRLGHVYGEPPYSTFLDEAFDRDRPSWIWVLVKSKGAPQPLVMPLNAPSALAVKMGDVERAIDTYIHLRDEFGEDEDWIPQRAAEELTDTFLPYGL